MATMAPVRKAARAASSGSGSGPTASWPAPASIQSRGPQDGQAIGWAWKRRSAGSSYSARQSVHIAKARHRRAGTVVRHAAYDRQPRAAMGAVGERVAPSAVGRVADVCNALGAGRRVRHHRGVNGAGVAGRNAEAGWRITRHRQRIDLHGVDPCQGRRLVPDGLHEAVERLVCAPRLNQHAGPVVADLTGDAAALRQPPDGRSEADALHHAPDADPAYRRGQGRYWLHRCIARRPRGPRRARPTSP